jgi:type VI secretion system secreted protein VgrG
VFVGMSGGGLGFGAILSGLMMGLENFATGLVSSAENVILAASPRPPLSQLLNAREMASLANNVYQDSGAPTGFKRLSDDPANLPPRLKDFPFRNSTTGFDAALYRTPQGGLVIAYRGTEPSKLNDWEADLKQAAGFQSTQYDEAVELAKRVQASYPGENIQITGHSLGGGLAQVGSAATGYPATTFNAAGVNLSTFSRYETLPSDVNAQNYTVQGEVLTTAQRSLPVAEASGEQITLEARDANGNILPLNPVSRHGMDSVQESLDYAIGQEQQ